MTAAPLHLVDATMFWSETGGGVRRYLTAKHDWFGGRAGWRHTIAVPGVASGDGFARLPGLPIPASGGYRLPLSRGAVARIVGRLQPDVVEAGDPYRVAWGVLDAARSRGVPAVAYGHSDLGDMASLVGGRAFGAAAERIARRYLRTLYDRFDVVLAPSRSSAERLRESGIARVEEQPLGVDLETFAPRRASAEWRGSQGFAPDDRVLVYAGRFAVEKHLDVLAGAVGRLGAPYALVLIGAGPVAPRVGPRVRLLPFVADAGALATALASADAFVHAGERETFGLSLLEAMACGTPAVVHRAGGLAELVDATCGISVEPNTSDAFAEAIEALFAIDRAALRAGARGRAEAYAWPAVFEQMESRYRRLVAAGCHPERNEGPHPSQRRDPSLRSG